MIAIRNVVLSPRIPNQPSRLPGQKPSIGAAAYDRCMRKVLC
jgi:hypothetical protein